MVSTSASITNGSTNPFSGVVDFSSSAVNSRPRVSVVVPCFNEELCLNALISRLTTVLRSTVNDSYEIVLVNDGSQDQTWEMMVAAAQGDAHILALNLSRNFGHQLALSAGLAIAGGEAVLVIDADLQDPPELLPEMLKLMSDGADVVYGQRTDRVGETLFKTRTAKLFYRMLDRMTDVRIPLDAGDFKLMRRSVVDALNAMPEQQRFIRGMVAWLGFRQVAIPYRRDPRFAGETKYPLRRMISFALDGVTGFSIAPLRLTTWLGFLFCLFALASSAYALFAWATSSTVHGWTSILVVTSLVGGVQLICLGIVGEYVGRIYLETKRRPNFIVREIRGRPHAAAQPRTHQDSRRRVASPSR